MDKLCFAAAVSASFYCSWKLTVTLTCMFFLWYFKSSYECYNLYMWFHHYSKSTCQLFLSTDTSFFFVHLSSVSHSILALFRPAHPVGVPIVYFCAEKCFHFLSVETGDSLSHWPWWGVYMRYHQCLLSLIRQWPITAPPLPALQHSTSDGLCCVHLFSSCSLR